MLNKLVWLTLAGTLGTLARYGAVGLVHRFTGFAFPWGTLSVNILGCFLAGMLWGLFEHRWPVHGDIRTIFLIGFLGAFTTFSAFILESGELIRTAEWMRAMGNILLQNGLGFIALFGGFAASRLM